MHMHKQTHVSVTKTHAVRYSHTGMHAHIAMHSHTHACIPLQCLELRNNLHGNASVQCASTYYHYGRALLEQFRASTGALGANVKDEVQAPKAAPTDGPSSSNAGAPTNIGVCKYSGALL